jgi:hypothetical protein
MWKDDSIIIHNLSLSAVLYYYYYIVWKRVNIIPYSALYGLLLLYTSTLTVYINKLKYKT